MKIVQVRYQGWGENWPLGTLADDGQQLLFEYSLIAQVFSRMCVFDDCASKAQAIKKPTVATRWVFGF